ncbi:MAG: cytochrome c [Paracoccaceae bacterium]|nr:cytochrome c [Paracoccaceae bacterium]
MNRILLCLSGNLALIAGLVATTLPSQSVATSRVEAVLPVRAGGVASGPDRIYRAQADAEPSQRPVSYANDQADRGKVTFEKECVECHGEDLKGGLNGGASLRSLNFEKNFGRGAPASGLYLYMSTAMPPNAPGRYSASTYADLMAYILKRNGFQAGAPLPADLDALDYLVMEK